MSAAEVQWIGSSCGRHGSYTFYKGFRINSHGAEKSYCLGEFYFVRNSDNTPICIAELQLIWHDASTDSKLASARLYFKPENTPFGRLSVHGEDELLYADQKVIVKCEDMVQWEYSSTEWTTGFIAPHESDFVMTSETSIDEFTGNTEHKYRLNNRKLYTPDGTHMDKIIILTFQAYCRYKALIKRLRNGMTIAKSRLTALGGVMVSGKSTRIAFCRECFNCPDLEKFHLFGDNKAPVLKGRPRKKRIRNSTLAKELKRKRFLADLEKVKNNLLTKKPKLSESEEGTESDLSEESTKSGESMDEADQPRITVKTSIDKNKTHNGLLPVKQVVMVINDKAKAPPPLIPTTKLKGVVMSPPPLPKVKIKTEVPIATKLDSGPPPLCPITKRPEVSLKISPTTQSRDSTPDNSKSHVDPALPLTSKAYTVVRSVGNPTSCSSVPTIIGPKPDSTKVLLVDSLGTADGRSVVADTQQEGKENFKDSIKTKKKRLRQPGSMKEFNEDVVDDDEKLFMRSLRDFMKSRDTPISKIPALGFKRVNLWTMYKTAQKLGGYEMVTTKRLWRQVYDALGGSTTITSAATYTRRHYERLLLPYERFVRGQVNNKKITSPQATKTTHENTVPREQPKQPINSSGNKNSPATVIERVSRITINSVGSTHRNESCDNKGMPNVTSNLSRDGIKTTVVKVKPNGAIPPYSVSIQSTKKECLIPSTIVTKSVDVPVSSVQSLPTSAQGNSTASDQMSKSVPSVTPQMSQRKSSSTSPKVTPDRTCVTFDSSHSININNSSKTAVNSPMVKKDYVTTSVVIQKLGAESQRPNVVTQKLGVVTQKLGVVTPKPIVVTQKPGDVMQKNEVVTQKPTVVIQKQNVVPQKQPVSELTTPKQVTQQNGREQQSASIHKPSYKVIPEEQTRTRPRKVSETKCNVGKSTDSKYLTISETYDLLHNRKRSIGEELDSGWKPSVDKVYKHESIAKINTVEPLAKRRKTPSPCHTVSQYHYVSHADVPRSHSDVSRIVSNTDSASRNIVCHSNTNPIIHAPSTIHSVGRIENGRARETIAHAKREKSDDHQRQQPIPSRAKDVVDLTKSDSSPPYSYRKPPSPLFSKVPYSCNKHDHDSGSCQRTEPRLHGKPIHGVVTQSKVTSDYRDEPAHENNHVKTSKVVDYFKTDKQTVEFDYPSNNTERMISQRSSAASPDAHFQEWRRRQGISQYPAYINTTNEPTRRRPSITEQLHPQTSPQEHRYIYVPDDVNSMAPRVIEEVPLFLPSKSGLYCHEEAFYGNMPFYNGAWPATGVPDSVTFKGDPETLRNNNHLRSTSCVFMPTSQMFGPGGPIAPISPPIINQGHMTHGPEAMHQHCIMTSPYSHNHLIVSQAPTRPVHSFT